MAEEHKTGNNTPLPPALFTQFIENQKRELEIRSDEVRLKAQEDNNGFVHAGKLLEAQERDRRDERQACIRAAKHRYWFVGCIVLSSLIFMGTLAYWGKDELVREIIKAVIYLTAGAFGGFAVGKHRQPTSASADKATELDESSG